MSRAALIDRIRATPVFDVAVIGGGATGLGVALDAALRGFSVALLESHDFAGGTSSRSTKLLHGGVRYLAQGNVALVREALAERASVLGLAPHLAAPLPFVMPAYRWWQLPFYGVGLKLYDLLAGRAGLGDTALLGARATRAALPGIQEAGLRGGVRYWDAQFEDARLALALARTIERAGGLPLNYAEVTGIGTLAGREAHDAGSAADAQGGTGARFVLRVADRRGGGDFQVRARALVNAAGVWVDAVRAQATAAGMEDGGRAGQASLARLVAPSQGVHVVVSRELMPGEHALLIPRTEDGRVLFAVPWLGKLVLGTTDTPRADLPREPEPFAQELDFILREAGRAFGRPLGRQDVLSTWVGLRPLVADPRARAGTKALSREHTIVTEVSGMITVTGGKWTTYRVMAEDTLQACFDAGTLPARPSGATRAHLLVGAAAPVGGVTLRQPPGAHLYGSEQARLALLPGATRMLGMGLSEAMVRFAAREEYAQTVEDVLARRWRALFLDAREAAAMAPAVAAILREELDGDPDLQGFLSLARHYLPA